VTAALARHVAPDGIASADAPFDPFLLDALLFRGNEVEKRVAGDVDQAMRQEKLFDLLARLSAEKRKSLADRGVFGAPAGGVEWLRRVAPLSLPPSPSAGALAVAAPDPSRSSSADGD
jgi:hypothetical protein